jgi:predicted nucleotidyltransferase
MTDPTFDDIYHQAMRLSAEDRRKLIEELSSSAPMLTAEAILQTISQHADALRKLGAASIGLFGSYARGEARLNSDLDLLVRMTDPHYSYFDLFGVQEYLEKLFEVQIDLVPEDSLKPHIRPHIMNEVIYAEGL